MNKHELVKELKVVSNLICADCPQWDVCNGDEWKMKMEELTSYIEKRVTNLVKHQIESREEETVYVPFIIKVEKPNPEQVEVIISHCLQTGEVASEWIRKNILKAIT